MASLFNTKISNTYVGLIKTIDNAVISASLRELTDGSGNQTGVYLNNAGDFKASGTLEFGSLKDTGENITITKFVDEADGIASNDNDTTIPTSAAVVDYVAARITLEDLDFSGDSGTGSVDLDSQVFAVVGTANEIETSAGSQQLQIGLPDNVTIGGNLQVNGLLKGNNNIVVKDTSDRTMAAFYGGGKSELYFNDSKKFETTSDGATVTGGLTATGGSVFTGATFSSNVDFADNAQLRLGTGNDLKIYHNGTDSFLINETGNLKVTQGTDDGDIIFESDDGGGGTTEYFSLDGGNVRLNAKVDLRIYDAKKLQLGNSGDLEIYHNNSTDNGNIDNNTGDLYINQYTDDGQIIFRADDGSGGIAQYFRLEGSNLETRFVKSTRHYDNVKAKFGDSGDLEIWHDGNDSYIKDIGTGDLVISASNDMWIMAGTDVAINTNDNGSVDLYYDNSKKFETTSNGITITGSIITQGINATSNLTTPLIQLQGDFKLLNKAQTTYINLATRDVSGSEVVYNFTNVGSASLSSNLDIADNARARFGASQDLQIYHDGSNSHIDDTGTGNLVLRGNGAVSIQKYTGENLAMFNADGGVDLYYDDTKKFETISSGVSVTGSLGINTTSPSRNLSVHRDSAGSVANFLHYTDGSNFSGLYIDVSQDSDEVVLNASGSSGAATVFKQGNNTSLTLSTGLTATFAGSVIVSGDLTVNGTTTTVNTSTLAVEDPLISMAKDNSANSVDIGFYGRYNDGTNRYLGLYADASDSNTFNLFSGLTVEPTTTVDKTATGYNSANLILSSLYVNDYVYHNGDADSYLGFSAADNFILRTGASTKIFADATNTYLYYNGNQKLRTTSSGVHITGGLTVGDSTEENPFGINIQDDRGDAPLGLLIHNQNTGTSADAKISFETQGSRDISIGIDRSDGNKFKISHSGNLGSNDFFSIDGSGDMVLGGRASIGTNGAVGQEVLTLEGNFSSSGNVKLLHAIRQGGAVAADLNYVDATTDMEFGTSTSHAFSLKTANTRAITIANNQKVTFTDDVTINGTEYVNNIQARTSAGVKVGNDDFSGFVQVADNGQVNFDSGNSEIHLLGGGTNFGKFFKSGDNFYINQPIQDKDIIFSGNDGGSSVTALTLDMSDSGFAIFNYGVKAPFFTTDGGRGVKQDGVSFVHTYSNGSDADAAGDLGSSTVRWRDLYLHGDIEASDSLTIDVTGDLSLDASGNDIRFKVNGVEYGKFKDDSDDFAIFSSIQDKDIVFKGNDGGTTITALTLDMSNAGSATFNDDIDLGGKITQTGSTTNTFGGDITISKTNARLKTIDGSDQLNIGNWDGVNYRFEGDSNRPMFLTSYEGNIKMGISGSVSFNVTSGGTTTTGTSQALASSATAGYFQCSTSIPSNQILHVRDEIAAVSTNSAGGVKISSSPGNDIFLLKRNDGATSYFALQNNSGTEHITVEMAGGKTGIGVTPTNANLEVKSVQDSSFDEGIGVVRSNSSQTGYINMVGGAMNINAPSSIPIKFRDGGTSNLEINANGHTVVNNDLNVEGGVYGKAYFQTTAGSTTSVIDTGIPVSAGVWELYYMGNPNDGGSSAYRAVTTGLIIVTVDFTNPNVVNEIKFEQTSITGGGSSNINLPVAVKILQGGSEYDELNVSTSGQTIRVKVTGWAGNVGTNGICRITRKL